MTPHRSASRRFTALTALAAVTLIVVVAATPSSAQSEPPEARTGPPAESPQLGTPQVAEPAPGETTRVIVELATPTRGAAELAPGEQASQQRAIAGTQANVRSAVAGTGSAVVSDFKNLPGMAVEATAGGLERLRASPDVADIRPDHVARPLLDVSTALVRADEAWPTATGAGYSIAVLDTGVDSGHDFLDGKVVHEACFADDTIAGNDPVGDCPNGQNSQSGVGAAAPCGYTGCDHGTHVAGIATSDGDLASDGGNYPGVARGANIVAEQVFHDDNGEALAYFSDIVEALEDVFAVRDTYSVAAVNLSLGGFLFGSFCDDQIEPLMYDAVQDLKDEGVATVVASGNDGVVNGIAFPACLSNVISVGNVLSGKGGSQTDGVAFDSNAAAILRLLAPGSPITSAVPDASAPRNLVSAKGGTSMAAPHVAGAVAVLRQSGVGAGLDEVDLVDQIHGFMRASGPCIKDPGNGIDYARLDVKEAMDWSGLPSALFWDVDCGVWFEDAADWIGFDPDGTPGALKPLAAGYPDGSFRGNNSITRGQDARMLYRLFDEPDPSPYTHGFTDVPAWLTDAVNWVNWPAGPASPDPLMSGTGSLFEPDDPITRAEKARQLHRAAGSPVIDPSCPATHGFTDVPAWVDTAVRWLTCPAHGPGGTTAIAEGYPDDTFRPNNPITRAETARMLQRFDTAGHTP